jgi:hypothetical protein
LTFLDKLKNKRVGDGTLTTIIIIIVVLVVLGFFGFFGLHL